MSSSSTDPSTLWSESQGLGVTDALRRGLVTWILATVFAVVSGLQDIFNFLTLPFRFFVDISFAAIDAFILTPFGLTSVGAEITGQELDVFGVLALPISVVIALSVLFLVILYLQFEITSNILPGIFVDNRLIDFIFTSPEEESEGED